MVYYVLLLSAVGLLTSWEILQWGNSSSRCLSADLQLDVQEDIVYELSEFSEQEREEETCTNSSLSPIVLLISSSDSKTRFLQLRLLQYLWHWKVSRHSDLWDHFPSSKVWRTTVEAFNDKDIGGVATLLRSLSLSRMLLLGRRTMRSLPRAPAQKTSTTHRRYTPSCRGNETQMMFEIKLGEKDNNQNSNWNFYSIQLDFYKYWNKLSLR